MAKQYYAHRSLGFVRDYFGEIGPRVRVSWIRFLLMKLTGYRVSVEIGSKPSVKDDEGDDTSCV